MQVLKRKDNFLELPEVNSSFQGSKILLNVISTQKSKNSSSVEKSIIKSSKYLSDYDEEMNNRASLTHGICTIYTQLNGNVNSSKNQKSLISLFDIVSDNEKLPINLFSEKVIALMAVNQTQKIKNDASVLVLSANSIIASLIIDAGFDSIKNIIQVGVRSQSIDEYQKCKKRGILTFLSREIKMGMYRDTWQQLIANNLADDIYVVLDLSVFDPSIFNDSVNQEPGGLLWDETLDLLKIVSQEKCIKNLSITGYSNTKISNNSAYFTAKLIHKIISYNL